MIVIMVLIVVVLVLMIFTSVEHKFGTAMKAHFVYHVGLASIRIVSVKLAEDSSILAGLGSRRGEEYEAVGWESVVTEQMVGNLRLLVFVTL